MERNIWHVLRDGTKKEFREWLDMMARRGMCALSDMAESLFITSIPEPGVCGLEVKLLEIDGVLREILSKECLNRRYNLILAGVAFQGLKHVAAREQRLFGTQDFFRNLEKCVRYESIHNDRKGIIAARLVIRSVMHSRGRVSFPRSPSAMRHQRLRQASETAAPARLAA